MVVGDVGSIVALVFALLCIGMMLYLIRQNMVLRNKVTALAKIVKEGDKYREQVKHELNESRSGTLGMGKRVLVLEKKLLQLDAKIDEANQQEPQDRLYSRAMKMVDLGAGVDELISECELPKAEAELLIRLHGS